MSDKCVLKESLKEVLSCLPERKREILSLRFGLNGKKINTLNDIGVKFKITRERVRQIERESFDYISTIDLPKCIKQFNDTTLKVLKKENGFLEENKLVEVLKTKFNIKDENIIKFLLNLNYQINFSKNNFNFKQFWVLDIKKVKEVKSLLFKVEELFKKNKELLSIETIKEKINFSGSILELKNILGLDKKIDINIQGLYGFYKWPIINPLSARDRAYYLLKFQIKKPTHFKEIANQLVQCSFNKKIKKNKHNVGVQTVHNELIKDPRFVLVGHGNYALKEWGYEQGVVRDIIKYVLVNNGSMDEDDIIKEVQKQRMVRPSTVKLNLHNKNLFRKNNNKYELIDSSKGVLNA